MCRSAAISSDVVGIIYRHMAGDARVEESAMLKHRLTGKEREVDVVIASRVAGHEVMVSVEATAKGRRADVQWVEQQVGKHSQLPTSKLVLISEAGFSADARDLAIANAAVPIQTEDVTDDDPALQIVNKLRSIWPKDLTLKVRHFRFIVRTPEGEHVPFKKEEHDLVLLADGTEVGTVKQLIDASIRSEIEASASN